mgnify:CR=1 FL=1
MNRKEECERVVLTKEEKRLLRFIHQHPHTKCERCQIWPLYEMNLVCPDTQGVDAFNAPIPLDTYCTSDFYQIYQAYRSEKRFWLVLKSLWLPILVSVITNLTVDGIQWWLPLLQQWFASSP